MALGALGRSCLAAAVGRRVLAADALPGLVSRALASGPDSLAPVSKPDAGVAQHSTAKDWKRVQDKQTGKYYYWNKRTDQTTPLGAPNPGAWQAATDEQSGQPYWWHPDTGETTAVGEPRPGVSGRQVVPLSSAATPSPAGQPRSAMFQLVTYPLALGLGMGLVFALGRVLLS